ncbi:MAG: redox-sensing transcriptional repressor Rex [Planctomycetes bacterium]|nr:redox-sensing transcriptional repressor Rex [Planctomycetota bacterium]
MNSISEKTIGRLSLYRRILGELAQKQTQHIYSHELAAMAGATAAQVRRDLMPVGYSGSPTKGYGVRDLMDSISKFMDAPCGQSVALVGLGNLGRAILTYFAGRRPNLTITVTFDNDRSRVGKAFHGCRCYHTEELQKVIAQNNIRMAIIAVPADHAQSVADNLINCGIYGLLNFAPISLRVPGHVYVEYIDITTSMEKAAYFTRRAIERAKSGKSA